MDVDDRQKIINLERDLLLAKDHAATLQKQNAILRDALYQIAYQSMKHAEDTLIRTGGGE